MQYQLFGGLTGVRVSQVALGTALMGDAQPHGADAAEVPRILSAYVEAGGNFIDCSDAYQFGASERLVGEFVAARRDKFVIVSKYGRTALRDPEVATIGNHRKAMIFAVEASLKRLKTEYIDVYLAHFDDGVTPIDEILRGFDDLVRAGKIVYAGLSNFPAWRIASAATISSIRGTVPISTLQMQYNLLERDSESDLLPMARAFGIGVMAYSPLAAGLLSGKYRKGQTGRVSDASGKGPALDTISLAMIDTCIGIADEIGCDPGAVAIAWIIAKNIVPIVGPRTEAQLMSNLSACEIKLSEDHIRRLEVAGARAATYPHGLLAQQRVRLGITDELSGRVV